MAGEEGVCKNPEVSWCPEVLEGKVRGVRGVRGVPVFGATVRDVRNVAEFINVNPNLGHSGHFKDPMNRMGCLLPSVTLFVKSYVLYSTKCVHIHESWESALSSP